MRRHGIEFGGGLSVDFGFRRSLKIADKIWRCADRSGKSSLGINIAVRQANVQP